jgi:polyhydroxyalkanoate synthesis repressor PhaR
MPDPQLIQVNKYPNRRLYDQTRSRHITHDELYDLVVAGHTVMVTESKTGADITNLVLAQAVIERSPEKFAAFPPEILHLMIRASEQMLRGMASGWLAQMMKGMGGMPGAGAATSATTPPWTPPAGFGWPMPGAATGTPADAVADLQTRMEAMMREIANLKGPGAR